jgi:hypothetical protein
LLGFHRRRSRDDGVGQFLAFCLGGGKGCNMAWFSRGKIGNQMMYLQSVFTNFKPIVIVIVKKIVKILRKLFFG